jgi:hypothetical protein
MDYARPNSRIRLRTGRSFSKTILVVAACTLFTAAGGHMAHAQETPVGVASSMLDEALQREASDSEVPAKRSLATVLVCGFALTAALGAAIALRRLSRPAEYAVTDTSDAEPSEWPTSQLQRYQGDGYQAETNHAEVPSALREAVSRWGSAALSTDSVASTPSLQVPPHLAEMVGRAAEQISNESTEVSHASEPLREETGGAHGGLDIIVPGYNPRRER